MFLQRIYAKIFMFFWYQEMNVWILAALLKNPCPDNLLPDEHH